jgi:hypothetical protein
MDTSFYEETVFLFSKYCHIAKDQMTHRSFEEDEQSDHQLLRL